ncbi:hydroxymethylglutaryl-CoA synthase family protein [Candidatus Lokiarchaeum ossiferum]|uniref:hydroxymethylglutaryl-CoA synthase family protein n=1 Tax=Candidatus Lokiarchaeum ossiferum TaxID=2951803 RepID=UPI00352E895F
MTLSQNDINDLFSNVGIDSIGFYAPKYYLSLENLAKLRDVNPDKFKYGLMAYEMRVPNRGEDCISIGLKAAQNALFRGKIDPAEIDALFVGTEATIYAVKSISNIYKDLLKIPKKCMTQDVSNACAAGTLAILNAIGMLETGIINKALIIIVDISKYDLKSPGEPTQGAGAVALVLTRNPRIAVFGKNFGKVSANINDFYRPEGERNAQVFGQYSVKSYLKLQIDAYDDLMSQIGNTYTDFYIFHSPYSKLPLKFMQKLIATRALDNIDLLMRKDPIKVKKDCEISYFNNLQENFLLNDEIVNKLDSLNFAKDKRSKVENWIFQKLKAIFLPPLQVSSLFGNMYSASIWAELMYILENMGKANNTIYFGSYGSGATAISGLLKIQPKFHLVLSNSLNIHNFMINKVQISVEKYEDLRKKTETPDLCWIKLELKKNMQMKSISLNYCDEGCIIPGYSHLNFCPKGHSGNNITNFPIIGTVIDKKQFIEGNLQPLKAGFVLSTKNTQKNDLVEFEILRWNNSLESNPKHGLINWMPIYSPIFNSPYLEYINEQIQTTAKVPIMTEEIHF